jgi:hypothetical protein
MPIAAGAREGPVGPREDDRHPRPVASGSGLTSSVLMLDRMAPRRGRGDNRRMKQGQQLHQAIRTARSQRRDAVEQLERVVARQQQHLIDAEVAATRRTLLRLARQSGAALCDYLDPEFLAVADRSTVGAAIVEAAVAVPGVSAVDLQVCEPRDGTLRIEASQGFIRDFLDHFATLRGEDSTACVLAWTTGRPVLVDRVGDSAVFAHGAAVEILSAAGSRAVYSFPLIAGHRVLGVLSLHGSRPLAVQDHVGVLAQNAAVALATVTPRATSS